MATMSKKTRDYIFLIFIVLFVAGTTLVSLYASGYKLNLSWPPRFSRLLIKTGMISVDSSPSGATIYLDDQPISDFTLNPWSDNRLTTAAKIRNVLPGDYILRLERDGYLPFNKKITVYSGQTTNVEDINLFRADLPFLITASKEGELQLSTNRKYLYITSDEKIITLKSGQERTLPLRAGTGKWLNNQDKLLLSGWLFTPGEGGGDLNYSQPIGAGATNWYYDEDTDRLYYQDQKSLSYLDLATKTSSLIISGGNYLAYQPHGDYLFVVESDGKETKIRRYSIKTKQAEEDLTLPSVGRYVFKPASQPTLELYDEQNKTLYLIDPNNLRGGGRTISDIISWQWLDNNTLFYNNNWEIYFFDLQQNKSSLLTRVGEEIKNIIWNSANDYLIFSTANSLSAYDLRVNLITKIFQTEKIGPPVLDNKNNTLYFWAKIGQQEGVYSLLLQ